MILCGWCGHITEPGRCGSCGRSAETPWVQRGDVPPTVEPAPPGRPTLDEADIRRRYAEARAGLLSEGRRVTVEALAERLDRSARTVREWRDRFDLR